MSSDRSSSAVRNLRSIFENKDSEATTPERRARSSGSDLGSREGKRPLSKVRSSFVAVGSSGKMAAAEADEMPELARESSASLRRPSFSENDDNHEELAALKRVISEESEQRELGRGPDVKETIPEVAVESMPQTPLVELKEDQATGGAEHIASELGGKAAAVKTQPPENPDKPVTGAEEEVGQLKPAEPSNEDAMSGGAALPPVVEDLRKDESQTQQPGSRGSREIAATSPQSQPANTITKTENDTSSAPLLPASKETEKKAPQGQVRPSATTRPPPIPPIPASTTTGKASGRDLNRKPSRTSLTAPTAASTAKASVSDKRDSTGSKTSQSGKPKPRETTKPLNVPSHLLAATASSRAKHEPEHPVKPSTTSTAKPSSTKPTTANSTQRSSLGSQQRPGSRTSQTSTRRPAGADGSFLERMMRPTASSQSKVHEKHDTKSAPVSKGAPAARKPAAAKTNGVGPEAKGNQASGKLADRSIIEPEAKKQDRPSLDGETSGSPIVDETEPSASSTGPSNDEQLPLGNKTPAQQTDGVEQSKVTTDLEATAAFDEASIR